MKNINSKSKKILIILIPIILLVIALGVSFAYWRMTKVQTDPNIVNTLSCLSTTITDVNNAINLEDTYPISDSKGMETTPYTFTVTNNCDSFAHIFINLDILPISTLLTSYVKVAIDDDYNLLTNYTTATPTVGTSSYTLKDELIAPSEVKTFNLRIWVNEPVTLAEGFNKIFHSKVVIITEPGEPTLKDFILAQGGGAAAIEAKGTPDFNVINGTSGLYATEDEYGTSYYYRGLKTELNNNLIWGGFQWKIVRINGDGSVRLLYNGTEAQFNDSGSINSAGLNTLITESKFNLSYNDAKYVGYMYGGADGLASTVRNGITSNAATYNETSTDIKITVENWYQTNILGKSFENQIVDNIFCNDRRLQSEVGGSATGPGYGNTEVNTRYAAFYKIAVIRKPGLECGSINDRFTANDTVIGNGALTYPIGLITADEASMAGLVANANNIKNYLYAGNIRYWTMTPYSMESAGFAYVFIVDSSARLGNTYVGSDSYPGLWARPVVSIKSDVIVSGEGTTTNPFKVK